MLFRSQARLNRLLWCLDLAPTGERKRQKGYNIDTRCACGHEAPSRTHLLMQCPAIEEERSKMWKQIRDEVDIQFAEIDATQQEKRILDEIRAELLTWMAGENGERDETPGDTQLCGLLHNKVSELITGEVQAREAEARTIRRGLLDKIFKAMQRILAKACKQGWEIWRTDYERRKAQGLQRAAQLQPREQRRQQDMRTFLTGK